LLTQQDSIAAATEGRILALDLGKKRIGLALSDELRITAQGLPTRERTRLREDLDYIAELGAEREVGLFLLGYPMRLNGQEGRQTAWVEDFGARLEKRTGIPVAYWDERFTSVEATRVLKESGISIAKRAAAVDRLAAVILLESYLERIGMAEPAG
jgi:putative Holliday junction resolvase